MGVHWWGYSSAGGDRQSGRERTMMFIVVRLAIPGKIRDMRKAQKACVGRSLARDIPMTIGMSRALANWRWTEGKKKEKFRTLKLAAGWKGI